VSERFLEEATRTARASSQVRDRAEFAFHAAIGLDPRLRDEVDRLLLSRFRDPATTPRWRLNLAIISARWGSVSEETAAEAAAALTDALTNSPGDYVLQSLAEGLVVVTARMKPDKAAAVRRAATAALVDQITHLAEELKFPQTRVQAQPS